MKQILCKTENLQNPQKLQSSKRGALQYVRKLVIPSDKNFQTAHFFSQCTKIQIPRTLIFVCKPLAIVLTSLSTY